MSSKSNGKNGHKAPTNGKRGSNGHGPLSAATNGDTAQLGAKNKGGRPLIPINWAEFDTLCAVQATLAELASYFDCSEDTIERAVQREMGVGFAEYFAIKKGKGRVSLRRKQIQLALAGDRVMLIWLGKQYLGQVDRQELTGKGGGPIQQQDVPADETERAERASALIRRAEMRKRGAA